MFKDELEYNLNINKKNGIKNNYVDLDYAIERLEDEGKSHILASIPMNKKITDGKSYIEMNALYNSLVNEENPEWEVMGH